MRGSADYVLYALLATVMLVCPLASCTTVDSRYTDADPQAYGSVMYSSPTIQTSISSGGIVSIGVSAAVGGTIGYFVGGAISPESIDGSESGSSVAEIVGTAAGVGLFGMTTLWFINEMSPNEGPIGKDRVTEWVRSLDEAHYLISTKLRHSDSTVEAITAIPSSTADTFQIRTIKDADFFAATYRGVEPDVGMLRSAIDNIPREGIPHLLTLFPGSPVIEESRSKFVLSCESVEECMKLSVEYPDLENQALNRAVGWLAEVEWIEDLGLFAARYPAIATEADSLAADRSRHTGDFSSYLTAFPQGASSIEFRETVDSLLQAAQSIPELANLAKRHPAIARQAETRAVGIAISDRAHGIFLKSFPHSAHRERVEAIVLEEMEALLSTAGDHVKNLLSTLQESGEYRAPEVLMVDGGPLTSQSYTDWDGDGDQDLYFTFTIVGDDVWDGKGPIVAGIGAVENRTGMGVIRVVARSSEFLAPRPFVREYRIVRSDADRIWLSGMILDPDDYSAQCRFDGSLFFLADENDQ